MAVFLLGVELDQGYSSVGVNEGLLIDAAHSFDAAYLVSVLGSQVARMLRVYFPMRFLLLLSFLQSRQLAFGENNPFLGHPGFQGFEALLEGLQIVA
jgi:hypothetical protein